MSNPFQSPNSLEKPRYLGFTKVQFTSGVFFATSFVVGIIVALIDYLTAEKLIGLNNPQFTAILHSSTFASIAAARCGYRLASGKFAPSDLWISFGIAVLLYLMSSTPADSSTWVVVGFSSTLLWCWLLIKVFKRFRLGHQFGDVNSRQDVEKPG